MSAKAICLVGAFALPLFAAQNAQAQNEASIITQPGVHPDYRVELEPHGLLAFGGPFYHWRGNLGAGVRATIPLVQNGPIPSINNNIGIGFGLDLFAFGPGAVFFVPVVGQWNFFLVTHFSLFVELGLSAAFGNGFTDVGPILGLGGRYHVTERIALTVRLEYPALGVGLSIFF